MKLLSENAEREIINAVVESVMSALETTKQSSLNNERYLQPKQAAIYADVSIQTLNKWVLEYGLPQAKIGGVVLYDTKDLDEFVAKHKV